MNNSNSYIRFEKILFTLSIFAFSLFPLIPNKYKGVPVAIFVLCAIASFVVRKNTAKINIKYAVFFSLLFFLYIFSLLYTDNIRYGLKKIETGASLFVIPFCFAMLYLRFKDLIKERYKFINIFIISTTIYSVSVILYFNYLGFKYCEGNLSHCLSYLDGVFILSEHPIYGSMFIALCCIFIINSFIKQNLFFKILLLIALSINIYVLMLLIRKGVIIALLFSFLPFLFNKEAIKKLNYKKITLLIIFLLILFLNFKNVIHTRFSELGKVLTYKVMNENNSTSIRFSIYKCVLSVAGDNVFFGQGVGDALDSLIECYKSKSAFLVSNRYNSHNQYLGILISVGLLGLFIFIYQLFVFFKTAFMKKDLLFMQVILFYICLFLTENILDRQSGVILFSFLMNYFFYYNLNKTNTIV